MGLQAGTMSLSDCFKKLFLGVQDDKSFPKVKVKEWSKFFQAAWVDLKRPELKHITDCHRTDLVKTESKAKRPRGPKRPSLGHWTGSVGIRWSPFAMQRLQQHFFGEPTKLHVDKKDKESKAWDGDSSGHAMEIKKETLVLLKAEE